MGQKRTPQLVAVAKRLRADGRSFAEIARELSKPGKTVSKAAIVEWLRDPAAAAQAAPAAAAPAPVPLDESEAGPDYVVRTLVGLLRREREREERFTAAGDDARAQQASRLAGHFAAQLAKLQSKDEDEAGVVKVKPAEMQGAADRAFQGLNQLADRVAAERATWPRCGACGQPCGEFAAGDKSPLRSLFERTAGRA